MQKLYIQSTITHYPLFSSLTVTHLSNQGRMLEGVGGPRPSSKFFEFFLHYIHLNFFKLYKF